MDDLIAGALALSQQASGQVQLQQLQQLNATIPSNMADVTSSALKGTVDVVNAVCTL